MDEGMSDGSVVAATPKDTSINNNTDELTNGHLGDGEQAMETSEISMTMRKTLNSLSNLESKQGALKDTDDKTSAMDTSPQLDKENNVITKSESSQHNSELDEHASSAIKVDEMDIKNESMRGRSASLSQLDKPVVEAKAKATPVKNGPRARKTMSSSARQSSATMRSTPPKTNFRLQLGEIEKTLGIKNKSLSDLDAKTIDRLILDRAKQVSRKGSPMHTPTKIKSEFKVMQEQKEKEKVNNAPDESYTPVESCKVTSKEHNKSDKKDAKNKAGRKRHSKGHSEVKGQSKIIDAEAASSEKMSPETAEGKKKKVPTATLR